MPVTLMVERPRPFDFAQDEPKAGPKRCGRSTVATAVTRERDFPL